MLLKVLGHRFIGRADAVILICKHSCCNQWSNTAKKETLHLWESREKLGRKIKELGLILFCEIYEILKAPFLSLIPRRTVC